MKPGLAIILAFAASCSSRAPDGDPASLDHVEFFVPAGWMKASRSIATQAEWTPSDNARKESITVISVRPSSLAPLAVGDLLALAQRSLPDGSFSPPRQFTTRRGFSGIRVEGEFVPAGKSEKYQRIHAAFFDGNAIVHVLYTAKDAEPKHFDLVIDTLVRKGA